MINDQLIDLRRTLQGGILSGLRYLNARTPHRFTGIFKYDGDNLINLFLIDREDMGAQPWPPFPATESYCSVMRATGKPFVMGNATVDARAENHPARERVISYCGVPLYSKSGQLFASLCHFDFKPILFSSIDLDFVTAAAPLLMEQLALDDSD